MRSTWLPAASLVSSTLLAAAVASAQPAPPPDVPPSPAEAASPAPPAPETLETPYSDLPAAPAAAPGEVAPPEAAPHQPKAPPADTRPLGPIRAQRRLALTGELGWNGLAGFGPVLTYHVHPHASVDMGAGFSLFGWKAGVRGRYNFLKAGFTPFLGLGFNATSGFGEVTFDPSHDANGNPERPPVTVRLKPSYLTQATLGFDYVHRGGFTLVGCLGYAWLLNEDNIEVLAGSFTEEEQQGIDIAFGSSAVISVAVGYSFE